MCERNERLVYARMTAWGQDGPLAAAAAHDINVVALSGALHLLGERDGVPPVPLNMVADFGGGGMLLAFGVAAALLERERSGRGQVLDVAMVDGVASQLMSVLQQHAAGRFAAERHAHWLQGAAPWYRAYRTADDRFLSVGALEPKFYAELLAALGLEPAQLAAVGYRGVGRPERADRRDRRRAPARGLARGPRRTATPASLRRSSSASCSSDPHHAARATYVRHDGALQPAPAPRFSRTPGAIAGPAPWPGRDTSAILGELGVARSNAPARCSRRVRSAPPERAQSSSRTTRTMCSPEAISSSAAARSGARPAFPPARRSAGRVS